jgi:putative membrane protein insertion efficiency factor
MMMARLLRLMVRAYQYTLGTVLPNTCRFQPTCSHYAVEALATHGAARGSLLAFRRILRCHPFSAGGFDPVPGPAASTHSRLVAGRKGVTR